MNFTHRIKNSSIPQGLETSHASANPLSMSANSCLFVAQKKHFPQPLTRTHNSITKPFVKKDQKTKALPQWHVILLDDDEHSYDYVIIMLRTLFGRSLEQALVMAHEVDSTGRVIVDTTNRERAELKQQQIHDFGADPLIPACAGSMTAIIEPAPN